MKVYSFMFSPDFIDDFTIYFFLTLLSSQLFQEQARLLEIFYRVNLYCAPFHKEKKSVKRWKSILVMFPQTLQMILLYYFFSHSLPGHSRKIELQTVKKFFIEYLSIYCATFSAEKKEKRWKKVLVYGSHRFLQMILLYLLFLTLLSQSTFQEKQLRL